MSKATMPLRDNNFFANSIGARSSSRAKTILFFCGILVFCAIVFGVYLFLNSIAKGIENEIERQDAFLTSEETLAGIRAVEEKRLMIESLQRYYQAMESILMELEVLSTIGTDYIAMITTTLPEDLFFQSLSMTNNQLQIQGMAPNRQTIAEYLHNMDALGIFEDVHISNIGRTSEEASEYTFVLSCRVKDVLSE